MSDPAHRDEGWYGYSPRTFVPLISLTALVSWGVWLGRWYFEDLSDLTERIGALAMFALAWAVWPVLAVVFCYRTVTYTYRLTDRAVIVDFGFLHPYEPPLSLADIEQVSVHWGRVGRWLNVGTVEIHARQRRLLLPGLYDPEAFVHRLMRLRQRLSETSAHDRPASSVGSPWHVCPPDIPTQQG
ncbi:MAG: PH domain-containing protein [Gemmataceae bacterium]|nr:PH domain-containing protein [Gemmataceae bacterium]MCS7270031.1 PH domain-containing protein [Gemmataceae bacterium]MDW8243965.1 PH domain-containing protein [Thermogemmata sp.]